MRVLKPTFLIVVFFTLSGCFLSATKMYEGKELDSAQLTSIKGMDASDPLIPRGWSAYVHEVDSMPTPDKKSSYIYILPGKHSLKVSCKREGTPVFSNTIEIDTKAGDMYSITVNTAKHECGLLLRK